jgi:hypothetical protein
MKSIKLGESFQLKIKESTKIATEDLTIELLTVTRMRPPKLPDQFILQIQLINGKEKKDLSLDGEYRFPSTTLALKWKNYVIFIRDIDYMASYVQFQIEKT